MIFDVLECLCVFVRAFFSELEEFFWWWWVVSVRGCAMCGVFSSVVVLKSVARWRVRSGDVRDFGVF